MKSCYEYAELISRLIDDDLSDAEQTELHNHLATCENCRQLYSAFSAVSEEIADGAEEVPDGFSDKVMSQIRRETMVPVKKKLTFKKISRYALPVAALLALVIAIPSLTMSRAAKTETMMAAAPMMVSESAAAGRAAEPAFAAAMAEEAPAEDALIADLTESAAADCNGISCVVLSMDEDTEQAIFPRESQPVSAAELHLDLPSMEITVTGTDKTCFVYSDGASVWYNFDGSDSVFPSEFSEAELRSILLEND